MFRVKQLFLIFAFSILISCAGTPKEANKTSSKYPVIQQLLSHDRQSVPLGEQFDLGEKIFRDANGTVEAEEFYRGNGVAFVLLSASLVPPGLSDPKVAKKIHENKDVRFITIPVTGDVLPKGGKGYSDAAGKFAHDFNRKMLALSGIGH